MEVVMEHKIDSSMDTFFGKLSLSPNLVSDQDTLSVFSYVKFLERKASILEDIVNTSHTLAEINQTLTSNHNCSLDETAAIKCIDVGVQTETVNQCECHIAPPEPLDIVTLSSSDLDVDVDEEQSDPKAADLLSKFSPISISSLSSIAISDIGKSCGSPQKDTYLPFEFIEECPFNKFCFDTFLKELDFSHNFPNRQAVYFGEFDYEYSGGKHEAKAIPPNSYLASICSYLEVLLPNYDYNSTLINYYTNGSDYIPRHSDNEDCINEDSYILTLSLGSTRTMRFTETVSNTTVADVELKHGSILVMSKQSQQYFQHELLANPDNTDSRVSVTFRRIRNPKHRSDSNNDPADVLETEPPACGYVPYEMNKPFPIRQQRPAENKGQRMKPKNSPQKNMYQTLSADKPDTLFISSSMFRNLNENMMSSSKHTAKVLFYPGANSYEMLQRLLKDDEFYTLDKSAIKQIFVLTGSNYIESLASGNLPFENATSGVNSLCFKLWETFVNAKISMINILPRADRCRNSYVMKLNDYIKKLCQSHGLSFVDTEFKNRLFSEFNGSRKQQYFKSGYFDDVHLNTKGIARLGRHLKYLAHIG
ncbi:hypothetical protein ACHWQZ_G012807 [Mnemiopsis leidyi]